MSATEPIPLCVDLDGTLVKLDTLHQALFLLLRRDPASILKIPGWWMKGKAHLKDQVMQRVTLDADVLPYHTRFLDYLREQRNAGRKLILATASNYRTAEAIAAHLGIFDETLASNADTNLRNRQKLDAIRERFPHYAYAGNDVADFPIWDAAEEIILVNPVRPARVKYEAKASHIFIEKRPILRMFIKAMRCSQWLKNVLVFSPLFLAHRFTETASLVSTMIAFLSFSFAASAIYVLNDLFDLSADQHHPRKCRRPFAAGELPIVVGAMLTPLLVVISLALCLLLPSAFFVSLLVYYALTTLYSWRIKQIVIADVLTLAVLYSMRIVAGAAATGTYVSDWFIGFALFLFLSLALVKRLSELREMENSTGIRPERRERGYKNSDMPLLLAFGVGSGCIAAVVFTMYLGSEKVTELYSRPALLWLVTPLLLYWIARIWYLAWRGRIHDDPLAFATRDLQTYLVAAGGLAAILYAI